MPSEATCLECDATIPARAAKCPGCGIAVVFCTVPACGVAYPAELRFCPFCNAPNTIAAAQVSAPTHADARRAPPAAPQPKPVVPATPPAPTPTVPFSLADLVAGAAPPASPPGRAASPSSPAPPARQQPPSAVVVPARLPATPLAVPGAAPLAFAGAPPLGGVPLRLDVLIPRPPRKGEQCVARLRATLLAASGTVTLDVVAACDVWPEKRITLHAALAPGMAHELPSLKFVPLTAGAEVVHLEATLRNEDALPLGRWVATKDLIVEDAAATMTGGITAEKGATVIFSTGGPVGLPNMGALLPGTAATWQAIPLQPDVGFQRRLKATCPADPAASPPAIDANRLWPAASALHAAVQIENVRTGLKVNVAVVCAHSASFGRGGDPTVAWWVLPAPFDAAQHNRLSRRHTAITLRAGRAWVSEHSTNGTTLNRQKVDKATPELLAQGDRVDLAGVLTLTAVELGVQRNGVHAVWLDRGDGLAGQLRYLLTDGTAPVAVCNGPGTPPMLWIAWLRGNDAAPALAVCAPPERWFPIPPAKTATLGGHRIRWQSFDAPCEQDHYLLG